MNSFCCSFLSLCRRHCIGHDSSYVVNRNQLVLPVQFTDGNGEVELRLDVQKLGIEGSKDVFVDVDDTSLLIRAKSDGTLRTLMNVQTLFDRIKSSETIWYAFCLALHPYL